MAYIGLCLVAHASGNKTIFETPHFANLKAGDEVVCDTPFGDKRGTVVDTIEYINTLSDEFRFVLEATRTELPLRRIKSRVTYSDFYYQEDKCDGNVTD